MENTWQCGASRWAFMASFRVKRGRSNSHTVCITQIKDNRTGAVSILSCCNVKIYVTPESFRWNTQKWTFCNAFWHQFGLSGNRLLLLVDSGCVFTVTASWLGPTDVLNGGDIKIYKWPEVKLSWGRKRSNADQTWLCLIRLKALTGPDWYFQIWISRFRPSSKGTHAYATV